MNIPELKFICGVLVLVDRSASDVIVSLCVKVDDVTRVVRASHVPGRPGQR